MSDLQEDIVVSNGQISGTSKYVTGYTGWSSKASERKGNYLALYHATEEEGTTITVEVIGGTYGPKTLDADGLCVYRLTSNTQKIKVTASKEGYSDTTRIYLLTNLTLQPNS